ncbi:MAG: hypothetical protein QOF60_2912 [Actinomycetota bacterium]|jgi:hypothetical protein|nr:hypothetical protein [Actinomycetota bacterium]
MEPVHRPEWAEAFAGNWIAVIDDEVIAVARTSKVLAYELHKMDHRKRSMATIEFVRPTSDAFIVGVG